MIGRRRPSGSAEAGPISAKKVRELYEEGSRDIAERRRAYEIADAMVFGEQNIRWDESDDRVVALSEFHLDRAAVIDNELWPASRTLTSKLLRRPLVFEVALQASSDAAVAGARKAEAALVDAHREHNWEKLRRDHVWATWKGGTGLLAVEWDPGAGQALGDSPDTGKPFGLGDLRCYALSVGEVTTEPGVRDIERARWWIRTAALPPGEVAELYDLDEAPDPDATALMGPLQQRMASGGDGSTKSSLCLVHTYYERPTARSKGQMAVVVGETVRSAGPWPFPFAHRLNLVAATETPVDRHWAGRSVLSAAVSPQWALNRAQSSIDEHMDKAGNARIVVEDGAVEDEDWDDDPASVLKVRVGTQVQPEYMSPPTMPSWWQLRPAELRQTINDILNVHDISRGDRPDGVTAASALSLLAEQDDTPLGAFAKELAECWGRYASLVLEIYAAKVTETRTARIDRAGQVPELVEWTGKDFAGQTTASVPADAVAPTSRGAQLQKGLLLLDKGVFGPPGDPATTRRFLEFVDLPGGAKVEDAVDYQRAAAQRENYRMSLGEVIVPEEFHDHAAHIDAHNQDRCSEDYERADPEIRAIKDTHIEAHETLAAEEAGAQVAKAAVHPALAAAAQAGAPPGSSTLEDTFAAEAAAAAQGDEQAEESGTPTPAGSARPVAPPPIAATGV